MPMVKGSELPRNCLRRAAGDAVVLVGRADIHHFLEVVLSRYRQPRSSIAFRRGLMLSALSFCAMGTFGRIRAGCLAW